MPSTHEPRYVDYQVVNAHTGEVLSKHSTRAKAESAKTAANDHSLRVRGGESVVAYKKRTGKEPKRGGSLVSRLLGGRR